MVFWMKFYNYTIEVIKISDNNFMIVIFALKLILKKFDDCIINDLTLYHQKPIHFQHKNNERIQYFFPVIYN